MVTIFSKPNCVQCRMTKELLKQLNIDFKEVDITTNELERQRLLSENKKSLPVIEVGNDSWTGFRPDRVKALA